MASPTKTVPSVDDALDDEWETISTGLGQEYDVENLGPLVGNFTGTTHKELDDPTSNTGKRDQLVYQFSPIDDPTNTVFLWGSYELDTAFADIPLGTKVRISFAGRSQFKSKEGPRQIKHYKVQKAKS